MLTEPDGGFLAAFLAHIYDISKNVTRTFEKTQIEKKAFLWFLLMVFGHKIHIENCKEYVI